MRIAGRRARRPEMRCGEADAFTHAYVDGELAGRDRESYEQHLLECDACSHACRLQARFGAYFLYLSPRGHRVTVMVFDGGDEDLDGPRRRVMAGRDVYFERGGGATTAAFRDRDGLNWVMTADVDEDTLGDLVQAALS